MSTSNPNHDALLKRISTVRTRLVARLPFFGYLALKLRPRIARPEDSIQTAAVAPDGTLIFNEEFLSKMSDKELAFTVCHEVLHPAMLAFERMQGRLLDLWNIAHDHAINLIIDEMKDANIEVPRDALCDHQYKGWSAEEIYDDLLKDTKIVQIAKSRGQKRIQKGLIKPGQDPADGKCKDTGKQPGGKKPQKGQGQGREGQRDAANDRLGGDLRPDLGDTQDGQNAARGDRAAQDRLATEWKISIIAAADRVKNSPGRGTLPAGLVRLIAEITESRINWIERLSRWVGENGKKRDYTFARPSRRSESVGQYLPSMKKYGVCDVAVMVDTSGSISQHQLQEGVAEVHGVCEDLGIGVRVLVCDADVHQDVMVEDGHELGWMVWWSRSPTATSPFRRTSRGRSARSCGSPMRGAALRRRSTASTSRFLQSRSRNDDRHGTQEARGACDPGYSWSVEGGPGGLRRGRSLRRWRGGHAPPSQTRLRATQRSLPGGLHSRNDRHSRRRGVGAAQEELEARPGCLLLAKQGQRLRRLSPLCTPA